METEPNGKKQPSIKMPEFRNKFFPTQVKKESSIDEYAIDSSNFCFQADKNSGQMQEENKIPDTIKIDSNWQSRGS